MSEHEPARPEFDLAPENLYLILRLSLVEHGTIQPDDSRILRLETDNGTFRLDDQMSASCRSFDRSSPDGSFDAILRYGSPVLSVASESDRTWVMAADATELHPNSFALKAALNVNKSTKLQDVPTGVFFSNDQAFIDSPTDHPLITCFLRALKNHIKTEQFTNRQLESISRLRTSGLAAKTMISLYSRDSQI
jgi:hypothetical protein